MEVLARPVQDLGQPVVPAVLGDRRGQVLRLPALAVGRQHHVPGDGVGQRGAVLPPQQVQAQVEARGGPRARDDAPLVDVEGVGYDRDVRVAAGQQLREPPVGRGAPAGEQAGGGERERTDAVRGDDGAARVRGPQRVEDGGGRAVCGNRLPAGRSAGRRRRAGPARG
ncbi:hypothetical protein GCM10020254_02220 [Streptomyces goshikiensis]